MVAPGVAGMRTTNVPSGNPAEEKVAAILAGGRSTRMGGVDKALALIDGKRLIDHVVGRLAPQCDRIILSARTDYETGLVVVPDDASAPRGPAGGVISIARHLARHSPRLRGFLTAPVDGPMPPSDLFSRLSEGAGSAIATDGQETHPTFAYWTIADILRVGAGAADRLSLKRLAELTKAAEICWPSGDCFANVNTPEDLALLRRN